MSLIVSFLIGLVFGMFIGSIATVIYMVKTFSR